MPRATKTDESRVIEACEVVRAQRKPNLSAFAREYGISYAVLYGRIHEGKTPYPGRKRTNMALCHTQEEALKDWVQRM